MKNIVRAFVVALVLTGAAASTHTSSATAKSIAASVQSNAVPIPTCAPDNGEACPFPR
jgi:hypothetical protein